MLSKKGWGKSKEPEAREARPSRAPGQESAPTMVVPKGTEISVDAHGQLSIRAPGNLVLQNSGSYGNLESDGGSIRIEAGVEVEAVAVRCSDHCYVQGSLTAWTVEAKSLQIEETGQAYVVLQDTERLEVGRQGRLVGNFSSEKELFLLFSRFADQLRGLKFFDRTAPRKELGARDGVNREEEPVDGSDAVRELSSAPKPVAPVPAPPGPSARAADDGPSRPAELPEPLLFALVLLEREAERKSYGPASQRALSEIIKLLRERDLEALQQIYRTLFSRIVEPREDVRRARQLVDDWHAGLGLAASPGPPA